MRPPHTTRMLAAGLALGLLVTTFSTPHAQARSQAARFTLRVSVIGQPIAAGGSGWVMAVTAPSAACTARVVYASGARQDLPAHGIVLRADASGRVYFMFRTLPGYATATGEAWCTLDGRRLYGRASFRIAPAWTACSGVLCAPYFVVPARIAGTPVKFIGWARNYEYAGTAGPGYDWLHYVLDRGYAMPNDAASVARSASDAYRGLDGNSPWGKRHVRSIRQGPLAGYVMCPAPSYHWMCQAFVATATGRTVITATVDSRQSTVAQARAVAIAVYLRARVQQWTRRAVPGW